LKALLLLLPIILFAFNQESTYIDNISEENNYSDENNTIEEIQTQESFLSSVEYGRMLYKQPRGISCSKCHGEKGRGGQKIAKYYDKHKNPKILKGVDIRKYSLKDLKLSLINQYRENNHRKPHRIMPVYYLTNEEVQAIYDYIQYNYEKDEEKE
jgi:cytochrome c553